MFRPTVGDRLVLSPMEPLVAGGAAEAFEHHLPGAGVKSVAWERASRERA